MKRNCAPQLAVACFAAAAALTAVPQALAQTTRLIRVPFVGCAADGQMGPVPAPITISNVPLVPARIASRLAYYGAGHMAVLAPRGWHCFMVYGSSGSTIMVTPRRHDPAQLLNRDTELTGPAVALTHITGGTSGRFEVAQISARVFPVARAFVQQVINEGLMPENDFPSGPYPGDMLKRRSETEVEFVTPANAEGLGTSYRISKNSDAIHGVAILLPDEDMDLVLLSTRLPSTFQDLAPEIIKAVEAAPSFLKSK